ncbi:MAG TPA: CBS domain-containing protein [Humisphaera sp.]
MIYASNNPEAEQVLNAPVRQFMCGVSPVRDAERAWTAMDLVAASPEGAVAVVGADGRLRGIVTGRDVARAARRGTTGGAAAGLVGSLRTVAVRDEARLGDAIRILNGRNALRRPLTVVPVVDAADRPVGLVHRDRLMRRLIALDVRVPTQVLASLR